METATQIPRWFWITLGLIVLATIIAIAYCNKKSKDTVRNVSSMLNDSVLREDMRAQVRQDVFDLIPDLQAALKQ